MKKALLYLLLFSYTTIVFKPLFPSIADTVAHIFWYSEHMATVHYEHGKYHVHYEYQQAAKNSYPEKDTNLPKSEYASEHLIAADAYNFSFLPVIQIHFLLPSSFLPHTAVNTDFPPPKA
jgi:hypothetical protein